MNDPVKRYRSDEQKPPPARRVAPGVIERIEGQIEVDPKLMDVHFDQQPMPVWDSLRIADSRTEHLDWMHSHFADETLYYGSGSEATEENP